MSITPKFRIAASVAALRQIDAVHGTDTAISEVAEAHHLDQQTVAQIAIEHAHAEALEAEHRRSLAARGARCLSPAGVLVRTERAPCSGCGMCKREAVAA